VNATGKASIPYASKILERWHSEGLKTPAEVESAEEKQSAQESENFETNEFFAAALRRSYGSALGDSDKETG
jgi:DNA replication protein DnaD